MKQNVEWSETAGDSWRPSALENKILKKETRYEKNN